MNEFLLCVISSDVFACDSLIWNISNIQKRVYVKMSFTWQLCRTVAVNFIDLAVDPFFSNGTVCRNLLSKTLIRASLLKEELEGLEPYQIKLPLTHLLCWLWGPWDVLTEHKGHVKEAENHRLGICSRSRKQATHCSLINQNKWHDAQMFKPIHLVYKGACETLL